jgi:NAD(P)-dependent dehydrogenase (short-subunit alcohol dehydrogenase family)
VSGTVLVLGGRSEIGLAVAQRLAGEHRRFVLAARPGADLSAATAALREAGAETVETAEFDADDLAAHGPFLEEVAAAHGPLEAVVLAFGILGDQARAEEDATHATAIVHTDYVAQVGVLTHAANLLRAQGHGSLVVFSSVAGVRVRRANYVYGSAKAGFVGGLRRPPAARPARVRHRADDRGHEPGAVLEHSGAGRRRHRRRVAQAARGRLGARGAPSGLLRDAPAAPRDLAPAAALTSCGHGHSTVSCACRYFPSRNRPIGPVRFGRSGSVTVFRQLSQLIPS